MSEAEILEFEKKILEDKDFSSDFLVYKMIVKGIIKEEQEKEQELDDAFKILGKDDLRNIIGPKIELPKQKNKIISITSLILSIAAVVVIAFTYTFNIQRSARNSVDDVIFDCYYSPIYRGGDVIDLTDADEKTIELSLPNMVGSYKKASEVQEISSYGINLAMLYLKIHDRDNARNILEDVKKKCADEDVKNLCDKLLKSIE